MFSLQGKDLWYSGFFVGGSYPYLSEVSSARFDFATPSRGGRQKWEGELLW